MNDFEKRLRRTFSTMAAEESLAEGLDKESAAAMLKWGEVIAEQFVHKTDRMEEDMADEYLAPYAGALHKLIRAVGHWTTETDPEARFEWWNRIEQNGKTLYSDSFILPQMNTVLTQLPSDSTMLSTILFVQKLIEAQRAKG